MIRGCHFTIGDTGERYILARTNVSSKPSFHSSRSLRMAQLSAFGMTCIFLKLIGISMTTTLHDIVDTAVAAGSFKTLVAAVTAAGLGDTLKGTGPFTVFAPSDDAFAKLPAGTVEDLIKPENKAKLTAILTYHVMAGKVMAGDVSGKKMAPATVNGATLDVDGTSGVMINGAKVMTADIACTNGVIHVIDTVLMPKAA
jgi:uncharacterized surface protein with fasciclin (FAS1) repeats